MRNYFLIFHNDEDGAVTVDWVVLTAFIVLLGLLVGNAIVNGATLLAADIGGDLAAQVTP